MPEIQSPVRSLGSTGANSRSRGSIAKSWPANVRATLAVVVHGMVNPPRPSDCAPGIKAWTAAASAGGAMMRVVPVSTMPAVFDRMLVDVPNLIDWSIPKKSEAGDVLVIGLQTDDQLS